MASFSFYYAVFSREKVLILVKKSNLWNSISWAFYVRTFTLKKSEIFCPMFYSRQFVVVALMYRFVFHSDLILIRCDLQTEICVFAYECLIVPALFLKKTIISPLKISLHFCWKSSDCVVSLYPCISGLPAVFHWSVCLCILYVAL